MPTRVTYDKQAKALYVQLIEDPGLLHCVELVDDVLILDKTELQQIAGIEILNVEEIEELCAHVVRS